MVVAMAITTIIENKAGEITLMSRPMFSTTSSIRPRVFIREPSVSESRHDNPARRAARLVPPSFPATAPAMINPQSHQPAMPLTCPIAVRRPVYAKNKGSNKSTGERFELSNQVRNELRILRHDGAGDERAEQKVQAQKLGDQRRRQ